MLSYLCALGHCWSDRDSNSGRMCALRRRAQGKLHATQAGRAALYPAFVFLVTVGLIMTATGAACCMPSQVGWLHVLTPCGSFAYVVVCALRTPWAVCSPSRRCVFIHFGVRCLAGQCVRPLPSVGGELGSYRPGQPGARTDGGCLWTVSSIRSSTSCSLGVSFASLPSVTFVALGEHIGCVPAEGQFNLILQVARKSVMCEMFWRLPIGTIMMLGFRFAGETGGIIAWVDSSSAWQAGLHLVRCLPE